MLLHYFFELIFFSFMFQFQIVTALDRLPLEFCELVLIFGHSVSDILLLPLKFLSVCFPLFKVLLVAISQQIFVIDHLVAVVNLGQQVLLVLPIS